MTLTNWRELCRELINSRGADYYRTLERARKALADEPAVPASELPLSPAAQAVLDAAIEVAESPDAEAIAAAVLRAAAAQLTSAKAIGTLRFIAAELKAHDAH